MALATKPGLSNTAPASGEGPEGAGKEQQQEFSHELRAASTFPTYPSFLANDQTTGLYLKFKYNWLAFKIHKSVFS